MIRFLLLAGLATALLPGEAEAKRGGGPSAASPAPAAKSRTVIAPGIGNSGTARPVGATRVPFPPASTPTVTQASTAASSAASPAAVPARLPCGGSTVGGFCLVN